jgi:cytochrome c2
MMNKSISILAILTVALAVMTTGWWLHRSTVQVGKKLAEDNCAGCHDFSEQKSNKMAPHLWGIVNRRAGSIAGFEYSESFRNVAESRKFSWTEANLDLLITDPDHLIPGTKMAQDQSQHAKAFKGIKLRGQRRELITYLRTLD